jgi:thiamine biosynthesis lipoprotein
VTTAPDVGRLVVRAVPLFGTTVSIQIVGHGATPADRDARDAAIDRAFAWCRQVEAACSRFDETSELRQLCRTIGTPVTASDLLFEAIRFAIAVAEDTDGAFDPTIGAAMVARGFDRNYQTGARVEATPGAETATYRDVRVDSRQRTIALVRPLLLDLGAVAKGLAIDLAARELRPFANFGIDAGGDLYLGGRNADEEAWSVGIRHPRLEHALIATVRVSDRAVCTSGDYERRSAAGSHLLDNRTGRPAAGVASATAIAPTAMVADALATAAFVLGPDRGLALLERHGVEGLIVSPDLARAQTAGWPR